MIGPASCRSGSRQTDRSFESICLTKICCQTTKEPVVDWGQRGDAACLARSDETTAARARGVPTLSDHAARDLHRLNHGPFRQWCLYLLRGRDQEKPHHRQLELSRLILVAYIDHAFLRDRDGEMLVSDCAGVCFRIKRSSRDRDLGSSCVRSTSCDWCLAHLEAPARPCLFWRWVSDPCTRECCTGCTPRRDSSMRRPEARRRREQGSHRACGEDDWRPLSHTSRTCRIELRAPFPN